MKEVTWANIIRGHALIQVLVIGGLALLMLTGSACAAPFVYITNGGSNTVSVIDTATDEVKDTINVGNDPEGVTVSPDGAKVFVANQQSNTISVIDTASNTAINTVNVGTYPHGIAVNPEGTRVYVTNYGGNTVSVIDTTTNPNTIAATVTVGNHPFGVAVTSDGTKAYVTNDIDGTVSVINTATNTVTATVKVENQYPGGIAINPTGTKAYVTSGGSNDIAIIDTGSNAVETSMKLEKRPGGVAVSPDGKNVLVAISGSNMIAVIDTATNTITTKKVGTTPTGVSFNPDGKKAYITNSRDNTVSVIDTSNNEILTTVPVGKSPKAFGQFIISGSASNTGSLTVSLVSESGSVEVNNSSVISVTVMGNTGNGISGATVNLSSTIGTLNSTSGTSNSSGKFVTTFSSSVPGKATITAKVKKQGFNDASAETSIEVKNKQLVQAPNVLVSAEPNIVKLDQKSTITVNVTGTDGTVISGASVYLIPTLGKLNSTSGTTDSSGKLILSFTSSTEGKATIKVQVKKDGFSEALTETSIDVNNSQIPFNVSSNVTSMSVYMSSVPGSAEIEKPSTITVNVTGTDGKGISGASVELTTNLGKVDPASGLTDSSGKFTSIFTSSAKGSAAVEAKVMKEGLNNATGKQNIEVKNSFSFTLAAISAIFLLLVGIVISKIVIDKGKNDKGKEDRSKEEITPLPPKKKKEPETKTVPMIETELDMKIEPGSIPADGKSTATVTLKIKDENGNIISPPNGRLIELSTTLGTISSPAKILPGETTVTAVLTSVKDTGIAKITASSSQKGDVKSLFAEGKVVFTELPPSEAGLEIQIEPRSIPADGKSKATVTVMLKDEKGNSISPPNGRLVELLTSSGTINSPVKILPGEMTGTATIISGSTAGTAVVTASSSSLKGDGKSLYAEGKILFTEIKPKEAGLGVKIEPTSLPADGKSKSRVIIWIMDENGKSIPSQNGTSVKLSSTHGTLASKLVVIPPREQEGITTITSEQEIVSAEVRASSNSLTEATAKVDFIPIEDSLDVRIDPGSISADGKSKATVTIKIKDNNGKFIPFHNGRTVQLSIEPRSRGTIDHTVEIPAGAHKGTASITSGLDPGIAEVVASSSLPEEGGKSLIGTAKVTFTPLS